MEETEKVRPKNLWLLKYQNPLTARLGREFFLQLPRTPGVYRFFGREGDLLYVGKAKDLRARLNSYRHAKPESVSRKVLRLIQLVVRIEFEELPDEPSALLKENQILREHKPPFNVVNKSPENYPYLAIRVLSQSPEADVNEVQFRYTTDPEKQSGDERLYGVFKSKRAAGSALLSLLRCLWLIQNEHERFAAPQRLSGPRPPLVTSLPVSRTHLVQIREYLLGRSSKLLESLALALLSRENLPRFLYAQVESDLSLLREFYLNSIKINQEIRREFGLKRKIIPQTDVDDLRILLRVRKGSVTPE